MLAIRALFIELFGKRHLPCADRCARCSIRPYSAPAHGLRFVKAAVFACTVMIAISLVAERPTVNTLSGSEQMDAFLKDKKYLELLRALDSPNAPRVKDYEFFAGVLANHTNQLKASIQMLKRALPILQKQGERDREQIALETLADGYSRLYRYAEAADTYALLEKRFGIQMSPRERDAVRQAALQWGLLRHVRPQTTSFSAFKVETKRDPLGLLEAPVEIHGEKRYWVVDTGANMSAISKSEANRLGLRLLAGTTAVKGVSGSLVATQIAVAPELRIGNARLRNVIFVLLDDHDLLVSQVHYQIGGIIGYPVLAALGKITFYRNGTLGVDVSTTPVWGRHSNLFVDEQTLLTAARIGGTAFLFTFDTGIQRTFLTARYYREHSSDFPSERTRHQDLAGVGGTRSLSNYVVESLPVQFAGGTSTLHDVPVLTERVGKKFDEFYGNLGLDAVEQFSAFTLDFGAMHFYVH